MGGWKEKGRQSTLRVMPLVSDEFGDANFSAENASDYLGGLWIFGASDHLKSFKICGIHICSPDSTDGFWPGGGPTEYFKPFGFRNR